MGHTHTAECYPEELICGKEETASHTHTDDCYKIQEELICGKEEIILHTHTDSCFDESGSLICGMLEVKELSLIHILIIVWKLDRFARNRYDSARYKAQLKRKWH